jgi:hypothetical protein
LTLKMKISFDEILRLMFFFMQELKIV